MGCLTSLSGFDYQSERHCAKNSRRHVALGPGGGKDVGDYLDVPALTPRWVSMVDRAVSYVPRRMLEAMRDAKVSCSYTLGGERSCFDLGKNAVVLARHADEARYIEERAEGKEEYKLSAIAGNDGCAPWERGYDMGGRCIDPYAFKDYGVSGYELMSMGVEMLYRDPSRFRMDSGMSKLVLEMLARHGS